MQKKYRIIGTSEPRMESIAKVTGMAKYTTDIFMPGMLYGKILRSPYAHARVTGIDVSEAKKYLECWVFLLLRIFRMCFIIVLVLLLQGWL